MDQLAIAAAAANAANAAVAQPRILDQEEQGNAIAEVANVRIELDAAHDIVIENANVPRFIHVPAVERKMAAQPFNDKHADWPSWFAGFKHTLMENDIDLVIISKGVPGFHHKTTLLNEHTAAISDIDQRTIADLPEKSAILARDTKAAFGFLSRSINTPSSPKAASLISGISFGNTFLAIQKLNEHFGRVSVANVFDLLHQITNLKQESSQLVSEFAFKQTELAVVLQNFNKPQDEDLRMTMLKRGLLPMFKQFLNFEKVPPIASFEELVEKLVVFERDNAPAKTAHFAHSMVSEFTPPGGAGGGSGPVPDGACRRCNKVGHTRAECNQFPQICGHCGQAEHHMDLCFKLHPKSRGGGRGGGHDRGGRGGSDSSSSSDSRYQHAMVVVPTASLSSSPAALVTPANAPPRIPSRTPSQSALEHMYVIVTVPAVISLPTLVTSADISSADDGIAADISSAADGIAADISSAAHMVPAADDISLSAATIAADEDDFSSPSAASSSHSPVDYFVPQSPAAVLIAQPAAEVILAHHPPISDSDIAAPIHYNRVMDSHPAELIKFKLDSGSSSHMVSGVNLLHHPSVCEVKMRCANGATMKSLTRGELHLRSPNRDNLILKGVLSVLVKDMNILSVSALVRDGYEMRTHAGMAFITLNGEIVFSAYAHEGLYIINSLVQPHAPTMRTGAPPHSGGHCYMMSSDDHQGLHADESSARTVTEASNNPVNEDGMVPSPDHSGACSTITRKCTANTVAPAATPANTSAATSAATPATTTSDTPADAAAIVAVIASVAVVNNAPADSSSAVTIVPTSTSESASSPASFEASSDLQ
jgi:hypothetical protein